MIRWILLALFVYTHLSAFTIQAQHALAGYEYVVTFPQITPHTSEKPSVTPMILYVAGAEECSVRVNTDALSNRGVTINREFRVKPNEIIKVAVSIGLMPNRAGTAQGYGIRLQAD